MTQGTNPSGQKPSGQSDIIPGVIAAVALALLVELVHMHPILAVVLAGLIYWGASLMMRQPPAPVQVSEKQLAAQLNQLGQSLVNREIERRVRDIAARAASILAYLDLNPDQDAHWREYIRECLVATIENTQRFAALAGRLRDPSHPAIRDFTDYITSVLKTL
ncbi:MAG: hypothetical protein JWQ02_490, partial [Capsulimonas sp.]|nr:hypothetical protein [Capsulimonas sp.]